MTRLIFGEPFTSVSVFGFVLLDLLSVSRASGGDHPVIVLFSTCPSMVRAVPSSNVPVDHSLCIKCVLLSVV